MKNIPSLLLVGLTLATALPGSAQVTPATPQMAPGSAQEPAVQTGHAPIAGGWVVTKGVNPAEVSAQAIHLTQADPKDTTAYTSATATLPLQGSPAWRVSFDVRFGQLRSAGASVRLIRGNGATGISGTTIGTVGADGWYKGMGVSLGADNRFGRPADALWHHFVYDCDGRTLAVWHDGAEVAEGRALGTPDRIAVGSWWDGQGPAGQQTEVWLRDVRAVPLRDSAGRTLSVPPVPPSSTPDVAGSGQATSTTERDDSTATLAETTQWMVRQINTTPEYLDREGSTEWVFSDASCSGCDLTYTAQYRVGSIEDNLNRVTVSLDMLDPNSVTYVAEPAGGDAGPAYLITYRSLAGTNAVKNHRLAGSTLVQGGFLKLASVGDARRFVRALKHAIRLCHAMKTGEPF
jgi:hypothetical protein